MKKLNREKQQAAINAANSRAERSCLRKNKKPSDRAITDQRILRVNISGELKTRYISATKMQAPTKLDIYKPENYELFASFINRLRQLAKFNERILICFRDTHRITAGAGLRLVAEVDHLLKIYPTLSIKCSLPTKQSKSKYKNHEQVVESALQQIGFFNAIRQPERHIKSYSNVTFWKQRSGDTADGSLAAGLLDYLPKEVDRKTRSHFYRGAIEAIANCVDHAYPSSSTDEHCTDRRWWMLAGVRESSLTIIVCDIGVGIPCTLPLKHPQSLITHISRRFNILGETDADLIRASTFIKRTRTLLTHRGKGGADIRSITDHYPGALLSIRSNRGSYSVVGESFQHNKRDRWKNFIEGTNDREWSSDHGNSICGTIIEWTVSLEALGK